VDGGRLRLFISPLSHGKGADQIEQVGTRPRLAFPNPGGQLQTLLTIELMGIL
jgi:hypothetical protein